MYTASRPLAIYANMVLFRAARPSPVIIGLCRGPPHFDQGCVSCISRPGVGPRSRKRRHGARDTRHSITQGKTAHLRAGHGGGNARQRTINQKEPRQGARRCATSTISKEGIAGMGQTADTASGAYPRIPY